MPEFCIRRGAKLPPIHTSCELAGSWNRSNALVVPVPVKSIVEAGAGFTMVQRAALIVAALKSSDVKLTGAVVTVKVAALLVTVPSELLTIHLNVAPLSASTVAGVV